MNAWVLTVTDLVFNMFTDSTIHYDAVDTLYSLQLSTMARQSVRRGASMHISASKSAAACMALSPILSVAPAASTDSGARLLVSSIVRGHTFPNVMHDAGVSQWNRQTDAVVYTQMIVIQTFIVLRLVDILVQSCCFNK